MKVLVYPRDPNPYQDLLYSSMPKEIFSYEYFSNKVIEKHIYLLGIPTVPIRLLWARIRGYSIFHLHWTYTFAFPETLLLNTVLATIYVTGFIVLIKLLGYKLVWTIHNTAPHEKEFKNNLAVYRFIAKYCNHKIVHYPSAIDELNESGISTKNTHVIPIGTYSSVYQNFTNKKDARNKLSLSSSSFIYLFLGMIRKYKGVEQLVAAFNLLDGDNKLIVAGKSFDKSIEQYLLQDKNSNIIKIIKYISDKELQYYYNAADAIVLPFLQISTTSSALLAFAFKKPIIAPIIGQIKDFPAKTGYYYDPETPNGLLKAMLLASKDKALCEYKGKCAFEYSESFRWEKAAKDTYEIYKSV